MQVTLTKNKYTRCHSGGTSYRPRLVLLPYLLLQLCLILLLVLIQIHWEWSNSGFIFWLGIAWSWKSDDKTSVQFSRSDVSESLRPHESRARQASLSITISQSSLRLTSIESVMPSSHLILCPPLLLLPAIPPSIRDFSNGVNSHEVAKESEFQR